MEQQQRGRGRARGGRARGSDASGGQQRPGQPPQQRPGGPPLQQRPGGPPPQQRPGPPPQQGPGPSAQQRSGGPQAWGPPAQAPQTSAWGPPKPVQQQQQVRAPVPRPEQMQVGRATFRTAGETGTAPGSEPRQTVMSAAGDTLATHGGATGGIRGRRRNDTLIIHTRPEGLATKQGTFGNPVRLHANYFQFIQKKEWTLYQYRVDFSPDDDRTNVRKSLLRTAAAQVLAGYLFDGTVLYTPNRLNPDPMELFVRNDGEFKNYIAEENIRITIRLVGDVAMGDYHRIQVFNIILRKCMNSLRLQLVGRNFFDALAKITIPDFKIELWPGYVTSIRQHESSILLCAEITNKVMRVETVWHLLTECMQTDRGNMKEYFQGKVIGTVVLTDYNNRTYRIDDVDWDSTPQRTFPKADGSSISYVEYYRSKYNLRISDLNQPMLISRAKPREIRAGMSEMVYLVPELCRMTGLTDEQRANFQLMKALATHTRVNPGSRKEKLIAFCRRLLSKPEAAEVLRRWDLNLSDALVEFTGRQLPPETIVGGNQLKYSAGEEADWTRNLRSNPMFHGVELKIWVVICPSRCEQSAQNFVRMLEKAASGMSWRLPFPKLHKINDDRPSTYLEGLTQAIKTFNPSLMMCVVTNNKLERYAAIKKKCSVDCAVPTQVMLAKNLDSKGAMSIATKVAIQLNCKLGGAPWSVIIPMSGTMIVGYDVCHDTSNKTKSFGALVASLDRQFTRYFNVATAHTNGEELSNDLAIHLIRACNVYKENNGAYPEKIIFYRDGVGDGQLPYVIEHELAMVKNMLGETIYKNNTLKMAFIIVSKRINTRIFKGNENPRPGTVVDDCITLPERYDFFIVSQCVRQGTVSPTSYNIIYDNTGLAADHLQRLTYKLTHLYYNWSGTVRVPAPCQYAHKLATLAGQALHRPPNKQLETVLHFL